MGRTDRICQYALNMTGTLGSLIDIFYKLNVFFFSDWQRLEAHTVLTTDVRFQSFLQKHGLNCLISPLLGLGVSVILVICLARQIDYPHFIRLAKNVPLWFFFGLFTLFLLLNIFRALSLCTYRINLSCHLLLLSTLNVNQRLSVLLVVILVVMIAAWFPFSLSGFGVIEESWAASLVMFADMEVGAALSVELFIHCCQVLMTVLLGLLGFVLLTPRVSMHLMSVCNQTQKRVPAS